MPEDREGRRRGPVRGSRQVLRADPGRRLARAAVKRNRLPRPEEPSEPAREHVDVHAQREAAAPEPQEAARQQAPRAFEPDRRGRGLRRRRRASGAPGSCGRHGGRPVRGRARRAEHRLAAPSAWNSTTSSPRVTLRSETTFRPKRMRARARGSSNRSVSRSSPRRRPSRKRRSTSPSPCAPAPASTNPTAQEPVPVVSEFVTEVDVTVGPEARRSPSRPRGSRPTPALSRSRSGERAWSDRAGRSPPRSRSAPRANRRPDPRDMPAAFLTGLALAVVALGALAIEQGSVRGRCRHLGAARARRALLRDDEAPSTSPPPRSGS